MKIRFYCDVMKGMDIARWPLFATTSPGVKGDHHTRMTFDVYIPDHLIPAVDAVSEVGQVEVVNSGEMRTE